MVCVPLKGFNISVLAGLLFVLVKRLPWRLLRLAAVAAGIGGYTVLVGAEASVVRAAIMGLLYILALHLGRPSDALTSLMAAAFLMSLHNPFILWDAGFQLSFAATLGLILFLPAISGWMARLLSKGVSGSLTGLLEEGLGATLAANLMALPIIAYHFGQVSLVSLVANLLILPAQPLVIIGEGLATIAGLIWLRLGQVVAWVPWLFLAYTIRLVQVLARLPLASMDIGPPHIVLVALYYGLLSAGLVAARRRGLRLVRALRPGGERVPRQAKVWLGLSLAVVFVGLAGLRLPDGRLHIYFLDVGQGDAILIRSPAGRTVLVDGGPSPELLARAIGRHLPFWHRILDLVVFTHPDEDHLAGLVAAAERYRVGRVLDSGRPCQISSCSRWQEVLRQNSVPTETARIGMRIQMGQDLRIEVLHPEEPLLTRTRDDDNNNSIVLRLTYGRATVLLTGDIEKEAEEEMLASGVSLTSTILKVAHHGSRYSSSPAFVEAVAPQVAVISVGRDNAFGHPAPEVVERLGEARILRTDEGGAVEVVTDGERYWIRRTRR